MWLALLLAYASFIFCTIISLNWAQVWPWLRVYYTQILLLTICYILVGVCWSLLKWYLFVKIEFNKAKEQIGTNWPPRHEDYKCRILYWILAWPISLLYVPIAFVKFLYTWISNTIFEA